MEPICNVHAEQEVLAAVLINNNIMCDLLDTLEPSDFFQLKHNLLFQAMKALYTQGKPIDQITIPEYFNNKLDEIGGYSYLASLLGSALPNIDKAHIQIIKEKSDLRKLNLKLQQSLEDINHKDKHYSQVIIDLQNEVFKVNYQSNIKSLNDCELMVKTCKIIEANYNQGGGIIGLETGIKSVDIAINGLQKKKLYCIAARPGMGKSAFALNICQNVSKNNRVLYYSLEMADEELGLRRLAMTSLIDSSKIERGHLTNEEWVKLSEKMNQIGSGKCISNCNPGIHINNIIGQAKQMKIQGGLDLIIVDHIGLMNLKNMGDSIREQITNICIKFKNMTKEFDIPIIILSQLSRECDKRGDKRPLLGDLKESGGIEENSDVVMFLYRDEYYDKNTKDPGVIECNIAKQRGGKTGIIRLAWNGEYQKITDIETRFKEVNVKDPFNN